jgi:transposase-like protein
VHPPERYARYKILEAEEPGISQREIARRIGCPVTTLRKTIASPPEGWEAAMARIKAGVQSIHTQTREAQEAIDQAASRKLSPEKQRRWDQLEQRVSWDMITEGALAFELRSRAHILVMGGVLAAGGGKETRIQPLSALKGQERAARREEIAEVSKLARLRQEGYRQNIDIGMGNVNPVLTKSYMGDVGAETADSILDGPIIEMDRLMAEDQEVN